MNDIRKILQTALPDTPPPSSITSRTAIAAGQRLRRWNRIRASLAAALAVLLIAGGITWLQTWGAGPAPVRIGDATSSPDASPSPPPSRSPSSSPSPGVSSSSVLSALGSVDVAPSVTQALLAATSQAAPGVTIDGVREGFAGLDLGPYETVHNTGQDGLKAAAVLTDPAGPSTLSLNLARVLVVGEPARCSTPPPGISCSTRTGPNGESIGIEEGYAGNVRYLSAFLVRPDLTRVSARVVNYSANDQPPRGVVPYGQRSTVILTIDQLVAIVTAPGVNIPPGMTFE